MDVKMIPPNKRRKLSSSASPTSFSQNELAQFDPIPTPMQESGLHEYNLSLPATRTVPHRIDEIHMQIQQKSASFKHDHDGLRKRQAAAVTSVITELDTLGNTILSTVTIGATTSIASPSVTAVSSVTSAVDSAVDTAVAGVASSNSTTSTGGTGTATLAVGTTTSHNSTETLMNHQTTSLTHAMSPSHHEQMTYMATMSDGDVETITRLSTPYVTTFQDGISSTICDVSSQCKLNGQTSPTASSQNTMSSAEPSSVSSPAGVGGGSSGQGTASAAGSGSTSNAEHHNDDSSTPPAGTIAGGVVGGAAGLAVILLIALVFLRWYKRRTQQGHHALPRSSTMSPEPDQPPPMSGGQGMAERAGLAPLVSAVPAFFRHQNRSQEAAATGERGFTRVSGRKLPSAFSGGMSSERPPEMPLAPSPEGDPSIGSYRESGSYEGTSPPSANPFVSHASGRDVADGVTLSPGPQRTPTIHTAGPFTASSSIPNTPIHQSPGTPGTANTLSPIPRSDTPSSLQDNRSSRFTEEV